MDKRYEVFCLADRYFYETPDRLSSSRTDDSTGDGSAADGASSGRVPLFEAAQRTVPEGWTAQLAGDWLHFSPDGIPGRRVRPQQGWKIHVSACLDNAEKTAAYVWDYCVARAIPFKFVPGRRPLHLRNSKYAAARLQRQVRHDLPGRRGQFELMLKELGALLAGRAGAVHPQRPALGPAVRSTSATAGSPSATASMPTATWCPRSRTATGCSCPTAAARVFHLPDWVALPEFLAPAPGRPQRHDHRDLPYRIERALHFSNGGGVYAGPRPRTGEKVVLKEARPHAGLAADGADAVTRLGRERDALEQLDGPRRRPAVRDWFTLGEHHFLVHGIRRGRTLNSFSRTATR